jgi:hypothetical protein
MHNYFAHFATLVNLELHEQLAQASPQAMHDTLDVSLITHKRMIDTVARLCRRGTMATPLFALLLHGMGGREGVQDSAELCELAGADSGLAGSAELAAAAALLPTLRLNASQQAAAAACLSQRLTLVQGPPGTGKTSLAVEVVVLWARSLGIRPVLVCADSNVAVDNIGVALLARGLSCVRTGRVDAVRPELHGVMTEALGG